MTADVLIEERSPENNLNTKSSTFNDNFFDKTYGKDYDRYIQIRNLWEAKNRFWCSGRFIRGPKSDNRAKYCYWIIFAAVKLLYFLVIAPYVCIHISYFLVIFTSGMFIMAIVFSIITSLSDPGIIPRYPILRAINNGIVPEKFAKPWSDLKVEEKNAKSRFWKTWKIWKPARSSHCPTCDWWVEVFDHHWPYLNNWIGKRNYKYFVAFLFFITLDGLGIIVNLIIYVSNDFNNSKIATSNPVQNSTATRIIISLVGLVCLLLLFLVIALCIFHVYLMVKGRTTKEELTKKRNITKFLDLQPSNFKGGQQWMTKLQFEMYLHYHREVREGKVKENAEDRIMEMFHKQRKVLDNQNIKTINRQYEFQQLAQSKRHSTFHVKLFAMVDWSTQIYASRHFSDFTEL